MARLEEQKTTYLLRNVPVLLYGAFRRKAKTKGRSIRAQIILLMEEFVNETQE